MNHKWVITPRGRKTKYYTCSVCGLVTNGTSLKQVNRSYNKNFPCPYKTEKING